MTTHSMRQWYGYLTPRERLALILAAAGRGDAVEQHRLQTSAPQQQFAVPDYFAHAQAFNEVAHYHLLTLLDLGLHLWQWWGLWLVQGLRNQAGGAPQGRGGKAQAAQATRAGGLVRYYAARFVAHVDGWKQFCTELHIDAEAPLNFMIGWDNIVRTENQARELAFPPEDAAWFVRMETVAVDGDEGLERGPVPVETAAEVAAGWHGIWTQLVHHEGGV